MRCGSGSMMMAVPHGHVGAAAYACTASLGTTTLTASGSMM